MRQLSILSETKKRMDKVNLSDLEKGDVFCFSSKEIKNRKSYQVLDASTYVDAANNSKGAITYVERSRLVNSKNPEMFSKVEENLNKSCFYLRNINK